MKTNNSVTVLTKLVKLLNLKITNSAIRAELDKHPNYYSLFAISDVLNHWKVPNVAYKVDYEALSAVPPPYIVHLSLNGGEFAVVTKKENEDFFLYNDRWNNKKVECESFKSFFSGNLLYAERDINSGEKNFSQKRRREQIERLHYPLLAALSLATLIFTLSQTLFFQAIDLRVSVLILFKSLGLITSIILLWHSIDSNNPLIQRLCTGEKADCNAILSSKAAKAVGNLSWSEVGFFYFSGTFLALLFNLNNIEIVKVLSVLSVCCLPYTFYSVYHQAMVAKQWCIFCLAIQFIFWLEAIAFLPKLQFPNQDSIMSTAVSMTIYFVMPIVGWLFIKPYVQNSVKVIALNSQLRKFKYNGQIFRGILKEQKKEELLEDSMSIILGNPNSDRTLTIVSNPYCQPCAHAHKILDTWLSENQNLRIQLIFSAKDTMDDPKAVVAQHFHRLYLENRAVLKDALHDWYENKYGSMEKWSKIYPISHEVDCPQLVKQKLWCEVVKIEATPTFFLDGYRIPNLWQLEDIKYMI